MKILNYIAVAALAAVGFIAATTSVLAKAPIISSFGQNAQLVCTNLPPGSTASIEWAPSALGPWTNNWNGLESVTADANGTIQVNVPMFYRVRGGQTPSFGKVTFTKWVSAFPNQAGLIANLTGMAGGDIGNSTFGGEVLKMNTDAVTGVSEFVAYYRFTSPTHAFTALIRALQTGATNGSKAVIAGVVTDGWLKGHAVEGEFTQIAIDHDGGTGYQGSLDIKSGDAPASLGNATFTKWVSAFPNQAGLIANLAGVAGGDIGKSTFSGEVLKMNPDAVTGVSEFVAYYRFTSPTHSFTALIQALQAGVTNGSKAVIVGIVTDGWLKGHAVEGEFTQIAIDHDGGTGYQGSLDIKSGDAPASLGNATFTKWVSAFPNQAGLIANLTGVAGGDIGNSTFSGEVLKMSPDAVTGVSEFVAYYRFTSPTHSFTALIRALQTGATNGSKAVIAGVVTDGWLKGHAVEGEFTQIAIDHDGGTGYQGSLDIKSGDAPASLGNATFTKWVSAFPNQAGLIANLTGVAGGDIGNSTFSGEVLKMSPDAVTGVSEFVAYYRFTSPTHSFTALIQALQTGATNGSKAVIVGVITDGWLKGHAVEGEFTQIAIDHDGGTGYQGFLDVKNGN